VEDIDYGGGYSDWSSDSYEGVVAPNSPPTPPHEVKRKIKLLQAIFDKQKQVEP